MWADGEQTKVSSVAPSALTARHHLPMDLVKNVPGIVGLTDALVAP